MLTAEYGLLIYRRSEWDQVKYKTHILGGLNYIYNVLTGYHYKAPHGMDVPKGKHFNPYFDHMIIGMPRQLYDGLIDYEDGTPASAP